MPLHVPRSASLAVGLSLVAAAVSTGATLQIAGGSGKPVPGALLTSLDDLDHDLARLTSDREAGKTGGDVVGSGHFDFIARIKALGVEKADIVATYFDGPTYGAVPWSEVVSKLDCLDSRLYLALGYDLAPSYSRKHVPDFLRTGVACKQQLETDLRKAVPPAPTPTPTPTAEVGFGTLRSFDLTPAEVASSCRGCQLGTVPPDVASLVQAVVSQATSAGSPSR